MFSVFGVTAISCLYYGAMSKPRGWKGTLMVGVVLGLFFQILIFLATWISYAGDFGNSYFRHWDSLNVAEGTNLPMVQALTARLGGLVAGPIIMTIIAFVGRAMSSLAPSD